MTNNGIDKNAPRPRLCHLRRWPDFVGYGFNLHCEKVRPGQYIGKVDPDSPAESAGLRENDRIVEVNFVPIGTENHKQVVARIKEGVTRNGTKYPDEVILLVVDQQTDEYYKNKSYVVRSTDANVIKLEAEIRNGSEIGSESPHSSNRSVGRSDSHSARETSPSSKPNEFDQEYTNVTGPTVKNTTNTSSPAISRTSDHGYDAPEEHGPYHRYSPPTSNNDRRPEPASNNDRRPEPTSNNDRRPEPPSTNTYTNINTSGQPSPPIEDYRSKPLNTNSSQSTTANGSRGIINLDMSAAEYREKLKAQSRKHDPRQNQQMSMKQKRDFIDGL